MFEKEAEEYADKDFGMYEPTDHERYAKETDWRNGAEFGYNKAKVEVEDSYRESLCNSELNLASVTEHLEELEKANEWHFVKDGDLPKDEDWKWCVSYRGYYYVAKYEEMFGCWTNQEYSEVMQPYAWKEIVLPKEIE